EPVLALAWKVPVTFFEATTAAAFSAFAEHPADVLLLEVGMGGRLDATNVIEKPALTVITPVALDHCEYLGGTLEAVAREKAGIIKRGMKCVVGRQHPQAMEVILHTAKVLEAPVYAMHEAWQVEAQGGEGVYTSAGYRLRFRPALAGRHQIDNAATAIACLECLPQWHFTDEAVRHGLAAAEWPARLQRLADQGEKEVWLDGGHNPHGAEALAAWAAEKPDAPLLLVCGLMRRKDAKRFFAPFASHARKLFAVGIPGEEESYPAAELAALAAAAGIPSAASSSLDAALAAALREAPPKGRILICGSLYLAGKVLSSMVS
ncbi:MAG: bifunctional folylpolyglutamate synthase/dihydrofolate synthase, partial [Alphaproteobacteria bacterium]|nr:bifunctional folylpolyglutamate synthase/dihydrofolate synthase [Alphaproteobacteria bacterium]